MSWRIDPAQGDSITEFSFCPLPAIPDAVLKAALSPPDTLRAAMPTTEALADCDSLQSLLEASPCDWEARGVLADLLEEAGLPQAAAGQRWMAERRKAPGKASGRERWVWASYSASGPRAQKLARRTLRRLEGAAMRTSPKWVGWGTPQPGYVYFDSRPAAEASLAAVVGAGHA